MTETEQFNIVEKKYEQYCQNIENMIDGDGENQTTEIIEETVV